MSGLRVELAVGSPGACPVAETAATAGAPARDVTWNDGSVQGDDVVEQFRLEGEDPELPDHVDPVFEYGSEGVYEFERDGQDCACALIEEAGYPIADVRANDRGLHLTLHLTEGSELSGVVTELRDAYDDVTIKSIARADADANEEADLVPIDRSRLTARQAEVIETAYAMGYFEYPREANATEVADALDICPSTLAEHLAAAQSKVFTDLIGAEA